MMRRRYLEPLSPLAPISRRLAQGAVLLAIISVAATRFGGIPYKNGLFLLGLAILLAVLAMVAGFGAFLKIWRTGAPGVGLATKAMLLAVLVLIWPGYLAVVAASLPVLHDVTTDLADPPSFSRSRAALDARQGVLPAEFDRQNTPDQGEDYNDIKTITLELSPDEVLLLAQRAASNLGWQVIDTASPSGRVNTGRIDAIARSLLFRFPDDITIRIRAGAGDTRVDVRSVSRVGRHDFGSNARNIRDFALEIVTLANAL